MEGCYPSPAEDGTQGLVHTEECSFLQSNSTCLRWGSTLIESKSRFNFSYSGGGKNRILLKETRCQKCVIIFSRTVAYAIPLLSEAFEITGWCIASSLKSCQLSQTLLLHFPENFPFKTFFPLSSNKYALSKPFFFPFKMKRVKGPLL